MYSLLVDSGQLFQPGSIVEPAFGHLIQVTGANQGTEEVLHQVDQKRVPICDDPKVAIPVDVNGGLGFKGVGPGTTLCSAASAVGPRRIFRITVR